MPLVVLCVLGGLRWVLDEAAPATASTLLSALVASVLLTVVAAVVAAVVARRHHTAAVNGTQRDAARHAVALRGWMFAGGAGLLAAPYAGVVMHGAAAEGFDRVAALTLVPLICVVIAGTRDASGLNMSRLMAALAIAAGALLIFPLTRPADAGELAGLLLPVAAVAAAGVLVAGNGSGPTVSGLTVSGPTVSWPAAAWMFAGAGAGLAVLMGVARLQGQSAGAAGTFGEAGALAVAVLVDAAMFAAAVWALRGRDAVAYSARWAWTPAVTVVSGLAIEHPGWQFRLLGGVVLLACGGWFVMKKATAPLAISG